MKNLLGDARQIYYAVRDNQGKRKLIPIRGVYVSNIKDDGSVALNNAVQNNNNNNQNQNNNG